MIDTGLSVHLPDSSYGQIADRSSMGIYKKLHVLGGVIDSDYQGHIQIMLHNFGNKPTNISKSYISYRD